MTAMDQYGRHGVQALHAVEDLVVGEEAGVARAVRNSRAETIRVLQLAGAQPFSHCLRQRDCARYYALLVDLTLKATELRLAARRAARSVPGPWRRDTASDPVTGPRPANTRACIGPLRVRMFRRPRARFVLVMARAHGMSVDK